MELTQNPWKTVSSRSIYDNPWISVREDQVINPKGGNGIYGVVTFKNIAIGIIPVDDEGYTYLVGQYRYTLNEYSWEIPEGGGPIGIDPLESAKRELKEETGFTADQWTNICTIHTSNSVTSEVGYLYLAQGLKDGESEPEDTEELQVKRVHLKDAVEMVMNNEITDSLSIAGILKAARILKI
ncbi:DNA mismatch repair protein MutT [Sporocytophaga myxococcoides]|uniref:GDP-mannose pyrophosphatase n=1 Tax=Sporocytophaga myxococcoides TaxID=153721 RepID=A0A098L8Y8_9BACT|nr:NUDIX hydrolase [Sporocytophaga myxococcoides]GAL82789.1 DNA mismatch repair protein MutT [Sporocytophaga myxococcoides]